MSRAADVASTAALAFASTYATARLAGDRRTARRAALLWAGLAAAAAWALTHRPDHDPDDHRDLDIPEAPVD